MAFVFSPRHRNNLPDKDNDRVSRSFHLHRRRDPEIQASLRSFSSKRPVGISKREHGDDRGSKLMRKQESVIREVETPEVFGRIKRNRALSDDQGRRDGAERVIPCPSNKEGGGQETTKTRQKTEGEAGEEEEEPTCRICMDIATEENPMIQPCRCTGSVKHVHEECLKTWLLSLDEDLDGATCELCNTKFEMEFEIRSRCLPREAIAEGGCANCLFAPLLLLILCILLFVMAILTDRYLINSKDDEEKGYTVALLITCGISSMIIAYLIYNTAREACVVEKLEDWKIVNYTHKKIKGIKEGPVGNDSGFVDPMVGNGITSRDDNEELQAVDSHRPLVPDNTQNHTVSVIQERQTSQGNPSDVSRVDVESNTSRTPLTIDDQKQVNLISDISQIGRGLTPINNKRPSDLKKGKSHQRPRHSAGTSFLRQRPVPKQRVPLTEQERMENFRRSFHSYLRRRNKGDSRGSNDNSLLSRTQIRNHTITRSNARYRNKRLLITEDSFLSQSNHSEIKEVRSVDIGTKAKPSKAGDRFHKYLSQAYDPVDSHQGVSFTPGHRSQSVQKSQANQREGTAAAFVFPVPQSDSIQGGYVGVDDSFTSIKDFNESFESRMLNVSSPGQTFIFNQSRTHSRSASRSIATQQKRGIAQFTQMEVPELDTARYIAEHGLETKESRPGTSRDVEGEDVNEFTKKIAKHHSRALSRVTGPSIVREEATLTQKDDEEEDRKGTVHVEEEKSEISGQTTSSKSQAKLSKKSSSSTNAGLGRGPTRSVGNISSLLGSQVEVNTDQFCQDVFGEEIKELEDGRRGEIGVLGKSQLEDVSRSLEDDGSYLPSCEGKENRSDDEILEGRDHDFSEIDSEKGIPDRKSMLNISSSP